mgnify:CR=1 FL=1
MKSYSKFNAIIASAYSADLYRDIRHRWSGIGFSYQLLLTTLVVSSLVTIGCIVLDGFLFDQKSSDTPNTFEQYVLNVTNQVPTLEWHEGKMRLLSNKDSSSVSSHDIFIEFGNSKIHLAHIEPNALPESLNENGPFLLLTSDAMLIRKNSGDPKIRTWDTFGIYNFVMTREIAAQYGQFFIQYIEENREIILVCFAMFFFFFSRS